MSYPCLRASWGCCIVLEMPRHSHLFLTVSLYTQESIGVANGYGNLQLSNILYRQNGNASDHFLSQKLRYISYSDQELGQDGQILVKLCSYVTGQVWSKKEQFLLRGNEAEHHTLVGDDGIRSGSQHHSPQVGKNILPTCRILNQSQYNGATNLRGTPI